MNKFLVGLLASLAALLFVAAFLVGLLSVMDAVSIGAVRLAKAAFALPLAAASWRIYRVIDREKD